MPGPVRLLPDEVVNQIAAGEVVERPASVLKELVENALDAGAGRVVVEVEAGGRRLIRVVDDGAGMTPDDLLLALERHATSKLAKSADLERILTLGFRGEALPSIAAVSRLLLRSRRAGAETGSEARLEAGSLREVREVGCPVGTVVEVRDLFYNTPARRKFLKSAATEAGHLGATLVRLALARPEVAFRYSHGGQALYDLPATPDLKVRVASLLGRETAGQMKAIEQACGPLTIRGLAGLPSLSRPNLDQAYVFVNGRFVRDRLLSHALGQAYKGLMPPDRKPVLVLMLELDPAEVDVNVHPAKVEVRFRQAGEVHQALTQGLRLGLAGSAAPAAPVGGGTQGYPIAPVAGEPLPPLPAQPPGRAWYDGGPFDSPWRDQAREDVATPAGAPAPSATPAGLVCQPPASAPAWVAAPAEAPAAAAPEIIAPAGAPSPRPLFGPAGELTVIGQLHGLYIICSSPEGLVIVDQHAAHERLRYEELKRGLHAGRLPRQGLLAPATLDLTPLEVSWAQRQAADWERLGLELAPFGGRTWSVSALPAHLAGLDPALLVRELLSELAAAGVPPQTPEFLEVGLRSLACRGSVKQGQRLGPAEMADLVARAAALPPPVTCPHGRPVFLGLSRRDLARHFRRGAEPSA